MRLARALALPRREPKTTALRSARNTLKAWAHRKLTTARNRVILSTTWPGSCFVWPRRCSACVQGWPGNRFGLASLILSLLVALRFRERTAAVCSQARIRFVAMLVSVTLPPRPPAGRFDFCVRVQGSAQIARVRRISGIFGLAKGGCFV